MATSRPFPAIWSLSAQERQRLWIELGVYSDGLLQEAERKKYPGRHRLKHPSQMTELFRFLDMRPPKTLRALKKLWSDTDAAQRSVPLPTVMRECATLRKSHTALLQQISDAQELKLKTLMAANKEIETLRRALGEPTLSRSRDKTRATGLGANARSIRYNSWDMRFDAQINKCLVLGFLRTAFESVGSAVDVVPRDVTQTCFVWYYDPICDDNLDELMEVAESLADEVEILEEEVERVNRSKVDLAISTAHEMDALRAQLQNKKYS